MFQLGVLAKCILKKMTGTTCRKDRSKMQCAQFIENVHVHVHVCVCVHVHVKVHVQIHSVFKPCSVSSARIFFVSEIKQSHLLSLLFLVLCLCLHSPVSSGKVKVCLHSREQRCLLCFAMS